MPSLARSVPKPLKVPSLARSVPKPLKVPSLARSVPKPLSIVFAADFLPPCLPARRAGCDKHSFYRISVNNLFTFQDTS